MLVFKIIFFIYLAFTTISSLYILIVSIVNLWFFRTQSRIVPLKKTPFVSIIIPARNEENDIENCILPLLNQDYPNYEILIIDDQSTDSTWQILEKLKEKSSLIQIFKSEKLPKGWKGKTHALHQLTKHAKGEIIIGIDADMEPKTTLISWTVGNMQRHKVDSLSAWPKHKLPSFWENFTVPVIYISTGFLIPLQFIKNTKPPIFCHAIGQFIAFKASSLKAIGGYEIVKNKINEDVNIAREIKRAGFKHVFLDGKYHISGNMYDGLKESFLGIERTIFEFFDKKFYPIVILSLFLIGTLILPPFLLFLPLFGASLWNLLFGLCSTAILLAWGITLFQRRLKWYSPFFFPIQMGMIIVIAWKSVFDGKSGRGYIWKGRKVE